MYGRTCDSIHAGVERHSAWRMLTSQASMSSDFTAGPDLRDRIDAAIRRILVDQLGVDAEVVAACDAHTPLLGDGVGLDSLEALAVVTALESAFDVTIDDDVLTPDLFASIDTLAGYVAEKVARA